MADLSQARAKELFNYDPETGVLSWKSRKRSDFRSEPSHRSWNTKYAGKPAGSYSAQINCIVLGIDGISFRAHRVIWLWVTGEFPADQIDHIDGDGANNRLSNLRNVTCSENHKNMPVNIRSESGVIGVRRHTDGAWVAEIKGPSGYIHLGSYKTVADAAIARRAAEKVLGYHKNHGRKPRATHLGLST